MKLQLAHPVLLVALTTSSAAYAQQPWIKDRRLGEGPGIRTGNLELHPSLAGEFGYDSNYFQRGPDDVDPVLESLRLRITPSLTLSTLREQRRRETGGGAGTPPLVSFDLVGYATYNEFIPLDDSDDFDDRSRLSGGAALDFELFPRRPITWDVQGSYQRQIDPSDVATGNTDYDRHLISAGTGLTWRPGGGLFDWRAGYRFLGTYFTEGSFDVLNNDQHTFGTRGSWRFLPRTELVYNGDYRLIRYRDDASGQPDGEVIESLVGINGLITDRFGFRVMGGWGASFYDEPQNFDGPIGNAELKFFLTPKPRLQPGSAQVGLSSVALGYDRFYAHSYLGPFYQRDRGYLTFEYFVGGVAVVSLRGQLARNAYPPFEVLGETVSDLTETRVGGVLFAEYRLTSVFGINTTVSYDRNLAGEGSPIETPNGPDDLDYSRFQAYLGVRLFW